MKKAMIITYGCKQNESDSEKIKGVLQSIGYELCEEQADADLIIFNTCAVREGAEDRVYGNVGALKSLKTRKPGLIIGVCGCMAARPEVADKFKHSFPHVNLVFGTNAIHNLPQMLEQASVRRVFATSEDEEIHELSEMVRDSKVTANVPIMYGCDNFCTYCIVPHVRGRERSRKAEDIVTEVKVLAEDGYKEILLLGQNVNSYNDGDIGFPELLEKLCEIDGIRRIRFISSHPKDFSPELIRVMASNQKICKQLHLPFQSGSDKILADMNRNYTCAVYIESINAAREAMPGLVVSSDVIVGFPTEEQENFEDTLRLIEELRPDMLFMFIYSKRSGTPAAEMEQVMPEEQVKANFNRLLEMQKKIAGEINDGLVGKTYEVLATGMSKTDKNVYTGHTDGGKIVNFISENVVSEGEFIQVKITSATPWALGGESL
jgi:tRNA-2-methylthio-N6-dimethylallyladenosine synthase